MKRLLALSLAAVCLGSLANAQELYTGTQSLADQDIMASAWGSGIITETDEAAFQGTTSLRISTRNFFQGGTITFTDGYSLASQFGDKNNLLVFTMRIPQGTAEAGSGRPSGAPGASGNTGSAAAGEGGEPGRGGNTGTPASVLTQEPDGLKRMRIIVATTDGLKSEAYLDLRDTFADSRGWRRAGIPLQAITGFARTNKNIASISFAGDDDATFFLGQIGILSDDTPIRVEPINSREMNIGSGQTVVFSARSTGATTRLIYSWDFNSTDGVQADAEGRTVRHRFRSPGTYTVTLTARDAYGLKDPYSTTMTVVVN